MFKKYLLAASLAMVALMPAMPASAAAEPKLGSMEFELPQVNILFNLSPFVLAFGGEVGFGYYFDKMNGLHIGVAPSFMGGAISIGVPLSYRARFGLTDKLSAYVGAGPSVNLTMIPGTTVAGVSVPGTMLTTFGGRVETGLRYHLNDSWMLGGGVDFGLGFGGGAVSFVPGLKVMAAMSM